MTSLGAGTAASAGGGPRAEVAARQFTGDDQHLFATLSGDSNPMHLDEDVARLTPAGARAVHGVHTVLWALETLAAQKGALSDLAALQVKFANFAVVGQTVTLAPRNAKDGAAKIEVMSDGVALTSVTLKFGARASVSRPPPGDPTDLPMPATPLDPQFEAMRDLHAWLQPAAPLSAFESAFPLLSRALGPERVRALALLSSLVGMVCPGMHSIFSEFTAEIMEIDQTRPGMEVWTRSVDTRFRRVSMGFAGSGLTGEVSALYRFPPIESSLATISTLVDPTEFAGRLALVVGGSRGLGAATAKLIVAGGGEAVITFARGVRQAEGICHELNSRYGAGRCSTMRFEVGLTPEAALADADGPFTHIYYFATPRIFRPATELFSLSDFAAFNRVYVEAFYNLIAALPLLPGRSVCYPSSVAVEKRPKKMTAYAMAKAAGEILCEDLQRSIPGLTIRAPRLPRILTDQTAVVPPVEAADAVEVMLAFLRAETAGARPAGHIDNKEGQ